MQLIPNAFYYPRGEHTLEKITEYATNKKFTHLIILSEKQKICNGLLLCHLPHGPTAFFRLSSYFPGSKIPGHGRSTTHIPELILNNFNSRLGRRTGRMLGSLFPHVTYNNLYYILYMLYNIHVTENLHYIHIIYVI